MWEMWECGTSVQPELMSINTQLTVVGVSTENGQTVLQNVGDQEPKPEQGLVLTLLQLLGAWIVRVNSQKLSHVILILVQVIINIHERKIIHN